MENDFEEYEIEIKEEDNELDDMEQPEDNSMYLNEHEFVNESNKKDNKKFLSLKFQHAKSIVKMKRKRNMNFTTQECELLIHLIRESKIIDRVNSYNESYSYYERKEEWQRVESMFNSATKSITRNATSLKEKYKIIKRNILMKLKSHLDKVESGRILLNYNDFKKFEKALLPILLPKIGFVFDEQEKSSNDNKEQNDNSEDVDFVNFTFSPNTSRMMIPDMISNFKILESENETRLNTETATRTSQKRRYQTEPKLDDINEEYHFEIEQENEQLLQDDEENEEHLIENETDDQGLTNDYSRSYSIRERIEQRNKNRYLRRLAKNKRKRLDKKYIKDVVLNLLRDVDYKRAVETNSIDLIELKRSKEIELLQAQIEKVRNESRQQDELHKMRVERLRNDRRMDEERHRNEERRNEERHRNEERRRDGKRDEKSFL